MIIRNRPGRFELDADAGVHRTPLAGRFGAGVHRARQRSSRRVSCRSALALKSRGELGFEPDELGKNPVDQSQAFRRQADLQAASVMRIRDAGQRARPLRADRAGWSGRRRSAAASGRSAWAASVCGAPARRSVVSTSKMPRVMPWSAISRSMRGAVSQ